MSEFLQGVVGVMVSQGGEVLLIPSQGENEGKREMVIGYHKDMGAVKGPECPAGAMSPFDNKWMALGVDPRIGTVVREIIEEALIWVDPEQVEIVMGEMLVRQDRPESGGVVDIVGYLALVHLTEQQERDAKMMGARPAKEFALGQIRLRDQATLQILHEYLESLAVPLMVDMEEMLNV